MNVSGQLHALLFYPGKRNPVIHCIGVLVGPRAGLDVVEKGKVSSFCTDSNLDSWVIQPVAYHLLYSVKHYSIKTYEGAEV
jgi:hypothetical protein